MTPGKPGWRTSEGQTAALAILAAVAAALITLPVAVQLAAVIGATAVACVYVFGRAWVKAAGTRTPTPRPASRRSGGADD